MEAIDEKMSPTNLWLWNFRIAADAAGIESKSTKAIFLTLSKPHEKNMLLRNAISLVNTTTQTYGRNEMKPASLWNCSLTKFAISIGMLLTKRVALGTVLVNPEPFQTAFPLRPSGLNMKLFFGGAAIPGPTRRKRCPPKDWRLPFLQVRLRIPVKISICQSAIKKKGLAEKKVSFIICKKF
jgi:hypothetical protein